MHQPQMIQHLITLKLQEQLVGYLMTDKAQIIYQILRIQQLPLLPSMTHR